MNNIWIRSIAILEIVGGIVGILFIFYVAAISDFGLSVWIIAPISLGIFILSLVAGILLWKGRENGRKASIIVQFIQLPKLVSPALIFMYSFGFDVFPHITLVKDVSNVGIQLRFLADGQLFFNSSGTLCYLASVFPQLLRW